MQTNQFHTHIQRIAMWTYHSLRCFQHYEDFDSRSLIYIGILVHIQNMSFKLNEDYIKRIEEEKAVSAFY